MSGRDNNNSLKPVIGVRPDGSAILSPNDLPFLPVPRRIVIENGWMQIDEWSFSLRGVSKRFLNWFKERLDIWVHLDPRDESRKWATGVMEAFREEIMNAFFDPGT